MTRALRLLSLSVLAVLSSPAGSALAAAGGGSSGFGGGGGGGGFGGGGGGGGFGGGGSGGSGGPGGAVFGVIILVLLAIYLVFWMYSTARGAIVRERLRIKRRGRERRVELAAAEAAEDDPAFAADAVRDGAARLFRAVEAAWTANDRARLGELVGPDLMVEWDRRLADLDRKGWHNVVEIQGDVHVEYLGLTNRSADADDRAVVRIEARLHDFVKTSGGRKLNHRGSASEMTTLKEYWTLGKRDGGWRVLSIEQDREGAHQLDEEIVASPWGDTERLHDEALVEGAVADKVVEGFKVADVADLDFAGDARAAALDLSLADGRFAPDVLETAARRAVAGWAEAVDGEDAALAAVSTPDAMRELLYPDGGERRRTVVRGPRIEQLKIVALDAGAEPPAMTVELHVRGRRYTQDRDTAAILSGSDERETRFTERWTMALTESDENPWRIADANASAARS